MTSTRRQAFTCAVALLACSLLLSGVSAQADSSRLPNNVQSAEVSLYMGAPVTMVEAPNGAIVNKRILDGADKVAWLKPTIWLDALKGVKAPMNQFVHLRAFPDHTFREVVRPNADYIL